MITEDSEALRAMDKSEDAVNTAHIRSYVSYVAKKYFKRILRYNYNKID